MVLKRGEQGVLRQNGSRQNGIGQNGTDKNINGTDKMAGTQMVRVNSSINPAPTDNMIFFINLAFTLTSLGFLCVSITYLRLLATNIN